MLYLYRHIVQDKTGIRFREETPKMPADDPQYQAGEARVAALNG